MIKTQQNTLACIYESGGERVMTSCNNCLHGEACEFISQRYEKLINDFFNEQGGETSVKFRLPDAEKCPHFKDRSRFVELPCKVGDTVYIIARISGKEEIIQDSVESFTISSFVDNTPIILFDGIETCDWDSSDFGKQVFLTKEQAEQALKEREDNV